MTEPVDCYIGIGSNMGNRMDYCREAVKRIGEFPETEIREVSPVFETEPMERSDQDWFFNCVLKIRTTLPPDKILKSCQEVEQFLGRKRVVRFGPRTIDIDLLLYGERIID
ncbi:MAG TPA: 2-amino-4-hydroxy-6-hydroxymethyldihydropteridine diphosphokinase, partial [Nitrospiria bacterium]|nr:2-amino-4-hydroxy-6-hydroxymethyldihydropteridine diphosphokinase [Nitrospiria bacterium]